MLGFFLMSGSLSSSDGLPFTSIPQLILYFVIELIVSLILSIFSLGFNKMFLDGSRGYRVRFEDLFYGFRHHPDRVDHVLQFLLLLISMACMAPGYILVLCAMNMELPHPCTDSQYHPSDRRNHSVGLLCFNFSQSTFLIADYDDLSAIQALEEESRKLMHGKKGTYFYLQLSFLGILFLCIFTCYIGFLWAIPYIMMTQTNFYRNIINEI